MNYEVIRYIIIGAVVLGITIFILRSFVKAALVALLVVFIFRIGWVYTGEDIQNSSFLNNVLHPDAIENMVDAYNNFAHKRNEVGGVIDPEALEDTIKDEIKEKLKDKVNKYLDSNTNKGNPEVDIIDDTLDGDGVLNKD